MRDVTRLAITYGEDEHADFRIGAVEADGLRTRFSISRPGASTLSLSLNMPGRHNVLNAAAAVAVCTELGVDDDAILRGLATFSGVGRRFSVLGEIAIAEGSVTLVDDYGHHPTEVAATLAAARSAFAERRLVVVYQPHRYSRTRDCYDDFVAVLATSDVLILLEVYAAGEEPIGGADGRSLSRSIRQRGPIDPIFVAEQSDLNLVLGNVLRDGDVLLMQGAGDIGRLARHLADGTTLREAL